MIIVILRRKFGGDPGRILSFALTGCESSTAAQSRICRAVADIAECAPGVSALFAHGNVIGLFLNSLDTGYGRLEAEALTNPDVIKLDYNEAAFRWDTQFRLAGLERIATAPFDAARL